jgi:hypothetical protein
MILGTTDALDAMALEKVLEVAGYKGRASSCGQWRTLKLVSTLQR